MAGCSGDSTQGGTGIDSATPTGDTGEPFTSSPAEYPCGQTIDAGSAGWTALALAQYPELEDEGGWVAVTVNGTEIIVAHAMEGCYAAIERACAHEGVAIDYVPSRGQFVCPRHGAIYDWQGDKVAGPQPTGLPVFPVGREGETIWVKV